MSTTSRCGPRARVTKPAVPTTARHKRRLTKPCVSTTSQVNSSLSDNHSSVAQLDPFGQLPTESVSAASAPAASQQHIQAGHFRQFNERGHFAQLRDTSFNEYHLINSKNTTFDGCVLANLQDPSFDSNLLPRLHDPSFNEYLLINSKNTFFDGCVLPWWIGDVPAEA